MFSDPGEAQRISPIHDAPRAAFQIVNAVGLHNEFFFRGSIARPAHSLSTLRSAGYPNATQDSLPAGGLAFAGQVSPAGLRLRFPSLYMTSSSAKLPGALTDKNMKQIIAAVERGEGESKKSYWSRIGVAFENRDGSYNLRFDYVPARMAETTIQLRDFDAKPE